MVYLEDDRHSETNIDCRDSIERLLVLAKQLPPNLRSDWEGTNHFELQSSASGEFFWLDLTEFWDKAVWQHGDYLKRVGLLMDIAVALKKAEPQITKMVEALGEAEGE